MTCPACGAVVEADEELLLSDDFCCPCCGEKFEIDFDEDDEDYEDFDEDDYVELECPECGESIYFDEAMLECGEELLCPNCNAVLVPVLEEDDED